MWNTHVLKEEKNKMDFLQLLKYVHGEGGKWMQIALKD